MNYTKGEWKVASTGFDREYRKFIVLDNEWLWITAEAKGETEEEAEANAHLVSAAPEMYEALKAIIDEARGTDRFGGDQITDALNAIAKAEGK